MQIKKPLSIRVISHNIRYATGSPFKGEEVWGVRRSRITAEAIFHVRHCPEALLGFQEVLHNQLCDIDSDLKSKANESWSYVGVGRDDGKTAGEYSPIFYRSDVWKVLDWKTVWLSETPETPSKGWDAASTRILTLVMLQHRSSGARLLAANTHLDDQGSKSRLESAKLILSSLHDFSALYSGPESPVPIVLTGDFNSEPEQEAYQAITSKESIVRDIAELLPENEKYGNAETFTGFGHDRRKRIDFIFLGPKQMLDTVVSSEDSPQAPGDSFWQIDGFGVLANVFDDGVYCSDHRAVVGDMTLT